MDNPLKTIQVLAKIGKILSKIAFIFSVIGFCACIAALIATIAGGPYVFEFGGVTVHGLIAKISGNSIDGAAAVISGWFVFCAGEAVLAKYAEIYFKNELCAGTPFTLFGAKELFRLGILVIAVPIACAIVSAIVAGVVAGFSDFTGDMSIVGSFNTDISLSLGIMFMITSLLCRYGAQLEESQENKADL